MKALLALAAIFALSILPTSAQDKPTQNTSGADTSAVETEMTAVIDKMKAKLKSGTQPAEADFAAELKELDTLSEKYAKSEPEAAASILMMKAMFYAQVLQDEAKSMAIFKDIKAKFPDSRVSAGIDEMIAGMKEQEEAQKINDALVVGSTFPAFEVKDTEGKPLSIASRKAKVVLVDFWATWCGPCVKELPNVEEAYAKYHDKGFDVIGISLDRDEAKLASFVKSHKMPWPQYFVGKDTDLVKKCGITTIPSTYLVDGDGKILARDLRGSQLDAAIAKALGGS